MDDARIKVVLLGRDNTPTAVIRERLSRHFDVRSVLETPPHPIALVRGRVRRQGGWKVMGQLLFMALVAVPQRRLSRARRTEVLRESDLVDAPFPVDRTTRVGSVNGPDCAQVVRAISPDVVVINGTRILSKSTLAALGAPVINMHVGMTPRYRGVHGAYWALAQGDAEHCGVTVHLVDEGIDTGGVLYSARIRPTKRDNFSTYPVLQLAAGLPLLERAVRDAASGTLSVIDGAEGDQRWYHPTLFEYLRHRITLGVR